jgi:hypothetical protein
MRYKTYKKGEAVRYRQIEAYLLSFVILRGLKINVQAVMRYDKEQIVRSDDNAETITSRYL